MKKEIFIAVCDRITADVPAIKWISADDSQLDAPSPTVELPCCIVDMSYINCKTITTAKQQVAIQIKLRVASSSLESANIDATQNMLDTLDSIHRSLQGWDNNRMFMPMKRISATPEPQKNTLKVYTIIYQMDFLDTH